MKMLKNFVSHIALLLSLLVYVPLHSSSDTSCSVTAIQLPTTDAGNFDKMKDLVKQAKSHGAELVIFPEESAFGWLNPDAFLKATPIPGKYSDAFAAIAKSEHIWLAAGLAEQGPAAGPGSQEGAHQVYNAGILINPDGQIVLHHRQFNVIRNSFDPSACQQILNQDECSYISGSLSDISMVNTPFGNASILVCADAYTYPSTQVLDKLKELQPDFVIIFWGITASTQNECGTQGFNAAEYAQKAALYLNSAVVVGANAIGARSYGRFLPSVYCGTSGAFTASGQSIEAKQLSDELICFYIDKEIIDK